MHSAMQYQYVAMGLCGASFTTAFQVSLLHTVMLPTTVISFTPSLPHSLTPSLHLTPLT